MADEADLAGDIVKAITLKQPWAALIFERGKNIENRTWSTEYRGPLAIVAGLGFDDTAHSWAVENLNYGCIVGVVDLVDVHEHLAAECDDHCTVWGEYRPFGLRTIKHWVLENPRPVPLDGEFPHTGFLGIRELDVAVERALLEVLAVKS